MANLFILLPVILYQKKTKKSGLIIIWIKLESSHF